MGRIGNLAGGVGRGQVRELVVTHDSPL
jgi:hypothetical protein